MGETVPGYGTSVPKQEEEEEVTPLVEEYEGVLKYVSEDKLKEYLDAREQQERIEYEDPTDFI